MEDVLTISIKGMVCERCIKVLTKAMHELGLHVEEVHLGSVTLRGTSKLASLQPIQHALHSVGFELLQDRNTVIISEIKSLVDDIFTQNQVSDVRLKTSKLIAEKFPLAYDTLSAIFSSIEGITLEKYIINKRLEKVKELLVYTELSLTEIAYVTGYSNVFHLSNQFKEHTGLSPSHFREIRAQKLKMQQNKPALTDEQELS